MTAERIVYRKLPGRGASAMEYHRLYLGPDHLMLVAATGFGESYRRFYFRDIQMILVRKSIVGALQSAFLGFCALICLAAMLGAGPPNGWIIPLGVFVVLLMVNILRGPTCICEIRTAVQHRRLGSVTRLQNARRLLALLRPLIDGAQGAVAPDDLRQRIDQARAAYAAAPPVIGGRPW